MATALIGFAALLGLCFLGFREFSDPVARSARSTGSTRAMF